MELAGVSNYIPHNMWLLMFIPTQGNEIKDNILYQDNQSTMRMLNNGGNSCTGKSRHAYTRLSFVKDRVDKGEVKVEYCPILQMLADFCIKHL